MAVITKTDSKEKCSGALAAQSELNSQNILDFFPDKEIQSSDRPLVVSQNRKTVSTTSHDTKNIIVFIFVIIFILLILMLNIVTLLHVQHLQRELEILRNEYETHTLNRDRDRTDFQRYQDEAFSYYESSENNEDLGNDDEEMGLEEWEETDEDEIEESHHVNGYSYDEEISDDEVNALNSYHIKTYLCLVLALPSG